MDADQAQAGDLRIDEMVARHGRQSSCQRVAASLSPQVSIQRPCFAGKRTSRRIPDHRRHSIAQRIGHRAVNAPGTFRTSTRPRMLPSLVIERVHSIS
jgi:hypothetical protein